MINTVVFFRNQTDLVGRIAYSTLVGVVGTILIFLFLNTFLHINTALKFMPWIIAFNTAVTGYSLLDKTRDRLKYKQLSSMGAGTLNVIIAYITLTLIFVYLAGVYLFTVRDLILFLVIGIVCSELGALLAIKYFKLSK
jgi:hypothetical protein